MTSPLVNLREFLARQHLAGIIVPRTDEFQNEYIAPANEALAWLCGFTGSNGLAVVLKDKAALFTDGRYSLQAKEEVNGEQFSLHHIIQESPALWLAQQIKQGDKIAYIPALHTPDEIEKFAQSVRLKGGSLAALTEDPLTALWQGRPARLASPVRAQDKAYAGLSSSEKIVQILPELKNQQLDAMLLTAPDSVCWLLNIRGEDVPYNPFVLGAALLYQDGNVDLFVDPARIKIDLGSKVKAHKPEDLPKILAKLKDRNLGFDKQRSSVYFQQQAIAAGAKIIFVKDPCQLPKACKNPVELQGIHAAHQRDGAAVTKFLAWLSQQKPESLDEMKAAGKLEEFRKSSNSYRGPSFPTICGFGSNGAIVHYRSISKTNKKFSTGNLLLIDSGGQYLDGTTDITRTIAIGQPTSEMRENFTRVLKGHIALATTQFPIGTSGHQLDAIARRPLWDAGLDYDHGTGHGVGCYLSVHEGPQRIAKLAGHVPLKPGMILSNEPGYYKEGAYGIRIENLIAVKELRDGWLGFETLTLAPLDPALIDKNLLNDAELKWLRDYHACVYRELKDQLDEETRAWLEGNKL